MGNRISRLHPFQYLQCLKKTLTDSLSRVYNPLNKLVRRIKDAMKRTESVTALIMVLIPLSFFLWIAALQQTNEIKIVWLTLIGSISFLGSVYLWLKMQQRFTEEETEEQRKRAKETEGMQTLIREMKGLRQDIRNEEAKRTKGKAPEQNQGINR